MWCSVCQSDVATEVGADNRRVNCSNCGHLLGGAAGATPEQSLPDSAPASGPDTRAAEARQLLDRWAKGHFLDPYGPPGKTGAPAKPGQVPLPVNEPISNGDSSGSATARQPEGYAMNVANFENNRDRETVDERSFMNDQQPADSNPQPATISRNPGIQNGEAADSPALASGYQEAQNPSTEAPSAIPDAAASAAELDRLTREIMARVSKITEARDVENQEQATANDRTNDLNSQTANAHNSSADLNETNAVPTAASHYAVSDSDQDHRGRGSESSRSTETIESEPATSTHPAAYTNSIRTDTAHQSGTSAEPPRYSGPQQDAPSLPAPGGWYSNIGQVLAYLGIIFLTAGTCGVIVSHFGGPAAYAPYGWLGATIGQMLLFLGIVTLISAGMEQTSQELRRAVDDRMNEVTQQLDLIGSRIMRVEEASSEGPRKPHLLSQPEQEHRRSANEAHGAHEGIANLNS